MTKEEAMSYEFLNCECGRIHGHQQCEAMVHLEKAVEVEYMPEYLRQSHIEAGNSGRYPTNGAVRLDLSPECAAELVDDIWVKRVWA